MSKIDLKLNNREVKILEIVRNAQEAKSSLIHEELIKAGEEVSLVTVKRILSELESRKILSLQGAGRSTSYIVSNLGKLITPVDATAYCAVEPDKRNGSKGYNFELFDALNFYPFWEDEKMKLEEATKYYKNKIKDISGTIHKKELERFVIELSWKSSKIEGNTYTLLDTENLLVNGLEAPGHSKEEALMILNHKKAFNFIYENKKNFQSLDPKDIEDVHAILVGGMEVQKGLRSKPVGVLGSTYQPLDNGYQIKEAVSSLCQAVAGMDDGYSKALAVLLGLSYTQPFEDGNKRTARLIANAVLVSHGLSPLSYRSVEEKSYKEATLVFYELNSFVPLKKIFIDQYIFSAKNYLV